MNHERILAGLNERQRAAVTAIAGPVLVIAGPGSGKTKALTHHIAYLMATGARPEEILAVTFTNKATEEMRERVHKLLSLEVYKSAPYQLKNLQIYQLPFTPLDTTRLTGFIGTFHSFAAMVLRQEAGEIGYKPNFTIFDEDDSLALVKEVMKELNFNTKNFPPPMVAAVIGDLKNDLIAWQEYEGREAADRFPRTIAQIYEEYQRRLKFSNAMDFDDLIFNVVRLFRAKAHALEQWQDRFRYIHIDEYQDTNTSQYELTRLLAAKYRNLFAIGDDSQAIYGWRHADYRNILNFERDWPEAQVIFLEENYRSTPEILEAANSVIAKNKNQKPKTSWTNNQAGVPPDVHAANHAQGEAEFVAAEARELHRRGLPWREIAILYRTNAQSRLLEEVMLEKNIPYIIIGNIRFFERREVKDVIAYLRYLQNPDDRLSEKRIVNVPTRGIGPKTYLAYLGGNRTKLPEREAQKIAAFEKTVARLREDRQKKTLAQFLRYLIITVKYEDYLRDFSPDGEARIENIRELVSLARKYDQLPLEEASTKLLEEIALASEQDQLKGNDARLKLMTLHSAKGLEFGAVFVTGLEEGILPHAKAIEAGQAELEEERRLCYVGMTRAKERLYLTWAIRRTIFGETQTNMPSRFLFELPPHLLVNKLEDPDDIHLVTEE